MRSVDGAAVQCCSNGAFASSFNLAARCACSQARHSPRVFWLLGVSSSSARRRGQRQAARAIAAELELPLAKVEPRPSAIGRARVGVALDALERLLQQRQRFGLLLVEQHGGELGHRLHHLGVAGRSLVANDLEAAPVELL